MELNNTRLSTRQAFGDALVDYMNKTNDKNLMVLTADLAGPTGISEFKKSFPSSFLDVGIAESNMIGVGAGMAQAGYKVFVTSFASFLTGRYDQIRCSVAYPNVPLVLVGTHSGMAIGRDGVTQMGLEDISIMRSLPNMVVLQPSCYQEAYDITLAILNGEYSKSPVYLRLHRQPYRNVNSLPMPLPKNRRDIEIYYTGCFFEQIENVVERLTEFGLVVATYNCLLLKPFEHKLNNPDLAVTIEDHSIVGGLGSIVAELLAESTNRVTTLLRLGLRDEFPESGNPEDLYEKYGLDEKGIFNSIYERYLQVIKERTSCDT